MDSVNILLGLTGSVATTLAPKIIKRLQEIGSVSVVMTERAKPFLDDRFHLDAACNGVNIFSENDEWTWTKDRVSSGKWKKDDPVLHIELRKKADVLVVAPLSANTLAKMANGICDNLLTSIVRAWDFTKPIVVAPAMNTAMWEHPITEQHLKQLGEWLDGLLKRNFCVVEPVEKCLACGDVGKGALANIDDIAQAVKDSLRWYFPLDPSHCSGIPTNHPGGFGFARKLSRHTGVDLYTWHGEPVSAMEGGTIVNIEPFTGPSDGSPWWNNTNAVLIEGRSGVICYGEIAPRAGRKSGQKVKRGDMIGQVLQVVKDGKERPDIVGHSKAMLHVELYKHGRHDASTSWKLDAPQHDYMLDPTPLLIDSLGAPKERLVQESYK
jgi:phosphopantothenoylcysteine decarboxylase